MGRPPKPECSEPTPRRGAVPYIRFKTDGFEDEDRLDALNTFSRGLYSYTPMANREAPPRLDLEAWALEDIAAAAVAYGPTMARTSDHLDAKFEDMVFLRRVRTGRLSISTGEETKEFGPGSLFLMQAQHCLTALDDGTSLCLRLPFARLGYNPLRQAPVKDLRRDLWQVRVLVSAVDALFETLPSMTSEDLSAVTEQLVGIVRAVISTDSRDDIGTAALKTSRNQAMRRFLIENLSCADLDVRHLQAQFNVSRATVYRAFDDVGGVSSFLRTQRLAATHRELSHTVPARGAIRQIAQRNGFCDQTSFLRMFRAQYGQRPSEILGSAQIDAAQSRKGEDPKLAGLPSLASFWANQP